MGIKSYIRSAVNKAGWDVIRFNPKPANIPIVPQLSLSGDLTVDQLKEHVLHYTNSLRIMRDGELIGYRFSPSGSVPCLYSTIACVLLKNLLSEPLGEVKNELDLIQNAQRDDGLFYDPEMECPQAYSEDWWGYRHLSFHAVMALALYGRVARYPTDLLGQTADIERIPDFIETMDWGVRVAYTSNAIQNYVVLLQYARDFQDSVAAGDRSELILQLIAAKVNQNTGLFGSWAPTEPRALSENVQAAYHFWLLWFYEGRVPPHFDAAIPYVLQTQNPCGGFGLSWNSSCCEDIDSIDPLARYLIGNQGSQLVTRGLERSLGSVMRSLNSDGGFVFRRGSALSYGYTPAMRCLYDESCLFFTWFRMLSLAYATEALGHGLVFGEAKPAWTWRRAPGLQFL